ncbi:MAG: DUF4236 domain-containing protein [Rhodobacteraceae bacterium]|jgi:hypothetical protein|nr:DUF4236 domain-containing protein [Paracoccaceae bacterium]
MPRSLPLAPFLRITLGRGGPALRLGPRAAGVTLGPGGATAGARIPGTGFRWRRRWPRPAPRRGRRIGALGTGGLFLAVLAALDLLGS